MHRFLSFQDFLSVLVFYTNPTILVEGSSDVSIIKTLFVLPDSDFDKLNVIPADIYNENNKGAVIDALGEISKKFSHKKNSQYIGIIDCDFNEICNNKKNNIKNLFYTDCHDIDAQIFSSGAFRKFLIFDNRNKNIDLNMIREQCITLSNEFGYYHLSMYELKFFDIRKKIPHVDDYINENLHFLETSLHKKLKEFVTQEEFDEIIDKVNYWKSQKPDPYHISNGHDLVRVLFLLLLWDKFNLKKRGWNRNYINIILRNNSRYEQELEEIEYDLRKCYERVHFQKSNLFSEIIKYQTKIGAIFIET